MCGIAGLFRSGAGALRARDTVGRMLTRIEHRGPDEFGLYFDDEIAMGTARLSIVDIAGGAQPMGDASGRHWIAFNGEIYNHDELRSQLASRGHVFRTRSDTEVLLHAWLAWGEEAFPRLNGPFAVALYDRIAGTLVLARDPFGERPLYYAVNGQEWAFASEIKCFLEHDAINMRFDAKRLASIFRIWAPLDDQSCFDGIDQVPAGAVLTLTAGGSRIAHYGSPQLAAPPLPLTQGEAIELTRSKLEQSVRLRLRSDVRTGTYLSGGLDSAIITSLAAEIAPTPIKTFSVTFDDARFDESSDQALLSRHLATDHHSVRVDDQAIVAAFPDAIWHAEVPVFRSAFVPMLLLSRAARSEGVKVVLTGEGADELFLGYDLFKEVLLRSAWRDLDVSQRQDRLASLYPYLDQFSQNNQAALYAYFDRMSSSEPDALFSHDLRYRGTKLATRLLAGADDGLGQLRQRIEGAQFGATASAAIHKAQWIEIRTLMSGYLLSTQGDRMAMANGVENRCPFLDPEIVNWGNATNLRFDDGRNEKYLLKRAFADRLPPRTVARPKQPYLAPDAAAFVNGRPDYLELIMSAAELKKIEVLDVGFCQRLVAKVMSAQAEIGQAESQAFMFLLSTAMVYRQFASGAERARVPLRSCRTVDGRESRVCAVESFPADA
ncbi:MULTISPECIES: asparagine synthase (glutamine-hydrolyzing) [unclassified Sphingomonas]|uniref:asparagine synthase (glutamine-hydrolyzing) n=1 Tax=unclassified Sphingomonas TaxID=196159 RepID=UPI0009E66705|nr:MULTISPECIES: asparagine synthase (glutamine-hydrolyzing) [unclassified Sphingomonas]